MFLDKNGVSNHLVPLLIVATHNGQRMCYTSDNLIKTVKSEYGHIFQIYEQLIFFDIMGVDSLSIKNLKEAISSCKKQLHYVSIYYYYYCFKYNVKMKKQLNTIQNNIFLLYTIII
jgi:hypothetical protein